MRDSHLLLVDYDPHWPEEFVRERARLWEVVGQYVETIEHIGSTSIPGLTAKPVIDILIGVKALSVADVTCIEPITSLGYEYYRAFEAQLPLRRYFRRSNAQGMRTHQIHLWQINAPDYDQHIVFRDYLRHHPHEADAYARLKRDLIGQFDDVNEYAEAKTDFIRGCLERAYRWRQSMPYSS